MPFCYGGHSQTGLEEACVVKATFLDTVPQASVLPRKDTPFAAVRPKFRCPSSIFKQVMAWLTNENNKRLAAKPKNPKR